jgi:hypothetical protein
MTQDLPGAMFGAVEAATFLGLPSGDPGGLGGARVAVLGADGATPYAVGFYCAGGQAAIRAGAAPYAASPGHHNFDLGRPVLAPGQRAVDCGDLAVDPADPAANRAAIAAAVAAVTGQGAVPLLLGGDDSVQLPMLEVLAGQGAAGNPADRRPHRLARRGRRRTAWPVLDDAARFRTARRDDAGAGRRPRHRLGPTAGRGRCPDPRRAAVSGLRGCRARPVAGAGGDPGGVTAGDLPRPRRARPRRDARRDRPDAGGG